MDQTATITRIEHYGLYVDTSDGPALVLIPDVSRDSTPDLCALYSVGDKVEVRLLRFVPEHGHYKATMVWDDSER